LGGKDPSSFLILVGWNLGSYRYFGLYGFYRGSCWLRFWSWSGGCCRPFGTDGVRGMKYFDIHNLQPPFFSELP
jgi:hypothetical protein